MYKRQIRRRKALEAVLPKTLVAAAPPKTAVTTAGPKTLIAAAKEVGLHGKWFVLSGEKDGLFSEAQIGQEPGDVISLLPEEDAPGLLSMG